MKISLLKLFKNENAILAGLLKDARTCKRCPALRTCMIYHKTVEYGTEDTSGIAELFSEITGISSGDVMLIFSMCSKHFCSISFQLVYEFF